jgi:phosphoribosylformylglycinamidine synthase
MGHVAVVRFPGSNCETETMRAVTLAGGDAICVDYRGTSLDGADAVILPGGFSYGDYLRSGAIARFAPIMHAVRQHAEAGRPVVGICNGFQILCEAHLLPGALMHNIERRFSARPVDVRVERTNTVMTSDFNRGEVVRLPQAHGEGRFFADDATLDQLESSGQIVLRYVAVSGSDLPPNPNGSLRDIAGICNASGNVVGFMPHPERIIDPAVGDSTGLKFYQSLMRQLGMVTA